MTKDEIERLRSAVLEGCAKNLRDFGYPDATADNLMDGPILCAFAKDMVLKFRDENCVREEPAYKMLTGLYDEMQAMQDQHMKKLAEIDKKGEKS